MWECQLGRFLSFGFILSIFLFVVGVTPVFSITFAERFEFEKRDPGSSITDATYETLKNRRVLFISGFMHEVGGRLSHYFGAATSFIDALEVESKLVHTPSYWTFRQSSLYIEKEIENYYLEDPSRPLIIIAHSKGAAEVLNSIFENPNLILENRIDRVVLLQAPLNGTPLADPNVIYSLWGFISKIVFTNETAPLPLETERFFHRAYHRFKRKLHARFSSDIARSKIRKISNRIFYVRTYARPADQSWTVWFLQKISGVSSKRLGKSDGIIPVRNQKLRGCNHFGTDLGAIEADHISLTNGWLGTLSHSDVTAFNRALFAEIL